MPVQSDDSFPLRATELTCTASDVSGNTSAEQTFHVIVQNATGPTIDPPADIMVTATSASGEIVTYTSPATHDLADGTGTANCAPASGSTFPLGETSVTCSATDTSGNTATVVSFTVAV